MIHGFVLAQNNSGIEWAANIGLMVNGAGLLEKTGSTDWGNAGFISKNVIPDGQSGNVNMTLNSPTGDRIVGLSRRNNTWSYEEVEYGFFIVGGELHVFESGNLRVKYGLAVAGQQLIIQNQGNVVSYIVDGVRIYTSSVVPSSDLYYTGAVYNQGIVVESATIDFTVPTAYIFDPETIVYEQHDGMDILANGDLQKTGATGWGTGGFFSKNIIEPGMAGAVELTVNQLGVNKAVGLAEQNNNNLRSEINYAAFIENQGVIIYELGVFTKRLLVSFSAGAKVKIVKGADQIVRYYVDDVLHYTSLTPATMPLHLSGAGHTNGVLFEELSIDFNAPFGSKTIIWDNVLGMDIAPNGDLTKNTGNLAWSESGFFAKNTVSNGELGIINVVVGDITTRKMIGLADVNTVMAVSELDYALYIRYSDIYVFEQGLSKGVFRTNVSPGTKLQLIKGEDNYVRYYVDGELIYTSTVVASIPLNLSGTFHTGGVLFEELSVDFGLPIEWKFVTGMDILSDGTLQKDGTSGWGNAGFISKNVIILGEEGELRMTVGETSSKMIGFAEENTTRHYDELKYAFFIHGNSLDVYESGVYKGQFSTNISVSQKLKIVKGTDDIVKYYLDNVLVYTSVTPVTTDLHLSGSYHANDAYFDDVEIDFESVFVSKEMDWGSIVGMEILSDGTLEKEAASGWGNAGFISKNTIEQDYSGELRFTVNNTTSRRMLGFANNLNTLDYPVVDYAFHINQHGELKIFESGTDRGVFLTNILSGLKLKIVKGVDNIVRYYADDILLYTSTVPVTTELMLTGCYDSNGASFTDIQIDFEKPHFDSKEIVWNSTSGMEILSNGTLQKDGTSGWGNAGFISKNIINPGEEGVLRMTVAETSSKMIGFAEENTTLHYDELKYAFFTHGNSLDVYESGVYKGQFSTNISANQKLKIVKGADDIVKYYLDNILVYTSATPVTTDLHLSGSYHANDAYFDDVEITFDISENIEWKRISGMDILTNGTLQKNGTSGWGNAGFISKNVIFPGEKGEIRFSVAQSANNDMIGFAEENNTLHYDELKYAFYIDRYNLIVYESGVSKGILSSNVTIETDLKIIKGEDDIVRYYMDDFLVYTSLTPAMKKLHLSGSYHRDNAYFDDLEINFAVHEEIVWDHLENMSVLSDGTLQKNTSAGWGNAGFISKNIIFPGEKGEIRFSVAQSTNNDMVGFAEENNTLHYDELKYAFYIDRYNLIVYESGVSKGILSSNVTIGTDLKIIKGADDVVRYYMDGLLIYTSLTPVTNKLHLSGSYHSVGAHFSNLNIDFTAPKEIIWKKVVDIEQLDYNTIKLNGNGQWSNSGFMSKNTISENETGELSVIVNQLTSQRMIGFANKNLDNNYVNLDYGFYINMDDIMIYESGSNIGIFSANVSEGTRLRIEKQCDNKVHYYVNDQLVHTSNTVVSKAMYLSGMAITNNSLMEQVRINFEALEDKNDVPYIVFGRNKGQVAMEVGDKFAAIYNYKFYTEDLDDLAYDFYDLNVGKRIIPNNNLTVKRGRNNYVILLTEHIPSSDLIDNHIYLMRITEPYGKKQYVKFKYVE
jgi:hypothetical protein